MYASPSHCCFCDSWYSIRSLNRNYCKRNDVSFYSGAFLNSLDVLLQAHFSIAKTWATYSTLDLSNAVLAWSCLWSAQQSSRINRYTFRISIGWCNSLSAMRNQFRLIYLDHSGQLCVSDRFRAVFRTDCRERAPHRTSIIAAPFGFGDTLQGYQRAAVPFRSRVTQSEITRKRSAHYRLLRCNTCALRNDMKGETSTNVVFSSIRVTGDAPHALMAARIAKASWRKLRSLRTRKNRKSMGSVMTESEGFPMVNIV